MPIILTFIFGKTEARELFTVLPDIIGGEEGVGKLTTLNMVTRGSTSSFEYTCEKNIIFHLLIHYMILDQTISLKLEGRVIRTAS